MYSYVARLLLLLSSFGLLLFSCNRIVENSQGYENQQLLYPQAGEGIALTAGSQGAPTEGNNQTTLRITLSSDYVVATVYNLDLDEDGTVEQLVIAKRPALDDYIRLVLIDYDRQRNSYIRSWEGVTQATGTGSFRVEFIDLTDDDITEIIGSGINAEGEYTMDIFSFQIIERDTTIFFTPIGSFKSASGIRIEYTLPSINPFIVIERQLRTVDNLEFEQSFHRWNERLQRFLESRRQFIGNSEINKELFERLLNAREEELLTLINGVWEREENVNIPTSTIPKEESLEERELSNTVSTLAQEIPSSFTIAEFDIDRTTLGFYQAFSLESFRVISVHKIIRGGYPTIQMSLINDAVETLIERAYIGFLAQNKIEITVSGSRNYNGRYTKYEREDANQEWPFRLLDSDTLSLQGRYSGIVNGEPIVLYFNEPYLIIQQSTEEKNGSYLLYDAGPLIMEINIFDDNRRYLEQHSYMVHHTELAGDNTIIHSLRLTPAIVNIDGVTPNDEAVINLQREVSLNE